MHLYIAQSCNPETSNELVFIAYFESSNNTFICQFVQRYFDSKLCIIKYGIINISSQSCDIRSETRNSSNNTLTDTVTVSVPMSMLTLLPTESELCFVAIGKTANFTTAIEGTFSVSGRYVKLWLIVVWSSLCVMHVCI